MLACLINDLYLYKETREQLTQEIPACARCQQYVNKPYLLLLHLIEQV